MKVTEKIRKLRLKGVDFEDMAELDKQFKDVEELKEKVIFLSDRCGTEMSSSLISMKSSLESFENSENILGIISSSEYLENKNRQVLCRLW